MLTYEIFFANLHLYHFLSFSWSRQVSPVRHFAYFVTAQAPLQHWISFQLLLSILQHQLHRTAQSNHVVLHLFQCNWVLSQMLYALLSISTYIFSLTDCINLGVTLKKGSSTNGFKIAAISSHAYPPFHTSMAVYPGLNMQNLSQK